MRKFSFGLFTLGLVFLSACTHYTLDENECRNGDWHTIGLKDGSQGYAQARFDEHTKACHQYGVQANLARYQAGWNKGVVQYCRPDVGYQEGLNNAGYDNVCPASLETAFLEAYNRGYEIYSVKAKYRALEKKFNRLIDDIADIDVELKDPKNASSLSRLTSKRADLEKDKASVERKMRVYELKHAAELSE
jgi:hypothetical protein